MAQSFMKSIQDFAKNRNFILLFLLVLVGFVIVDCNTKMFSKLIEGTGCHAGDNAPAPAPSNSRNNSGSNSRVTDCGRGTGFPSKNPADSASSGCDLSSVNALGDSDSGGRILGNVEGENLFVSAQGPYGREVPKTLQGDYSTLKSFGLTNLKDVVNYIPGAGPSQFTKGSMNNNNAAGRRNTNVNKNTNENKNTNVNKNTNNNNGCKPIVYGADWCGWTKKQLKYLDDKKMDYEYIDCSKNKDACPSEVKGYPAIKHCDV